LSEADLNPNPDAAGFVLAGGRSSRMGEDKALVRLGGQPLVVHALALLRGAGLTASLAGGSSTLAAFAPLVQDSYPGQGPLAGICAALASTSARLNVFLPIDLPLLPVSVIAFLVEHARRTGRPVTVPSVNGFDQTFPAVLDRIVLPELEGELRAGRLGCFSAFQSVSANLGSAMSVVPVEALVQSGQVAHPAGLPATRWFLNVNAPEGLRLAHEYRNQSNRVS
jgi:molybdopterin-guanine dinucleotide biosynthesis protein A